MILEILSIGLIISACLALFLDEAVYSVVALAGTFFFTALIYALDGAVFVAIFQFAVGVGTLTILFLSGELLSEKAVKKTSPNKALALIAGGVALSLPALFLSISGSTSAGVNISFGNGLWNLNGMDVILQGLVILTVALGIVIVLYEKRNGGK
jgi:NADH:ubiquinone oxidoreductase subunit 6 (subunit J)